MTVKDLMKLLKQVNPDSPIYLFTGDICVSPQEIDGILVNPVSVILETATYYDYDLYFNSFDPEGQENPILNKTEPFYLYRKEE